jgi:hypothetical protein
VGVGVAQQNGGNVEGRMQGKAWDAARGLQPGTGYYVIEQSSEKNVQCMALGWCAAVPPKCNHAVYPEV